jgi:hypothetical protein
MKIITGMKQNQGQTEEMQEKITLPKQRNASIVKKALEKPLRSSSDT